MSYLSMYIVHGIKFKLAWIGGICRQSPSLIGLMDFRLSSLSPTLSISTYLVSHWLSELVQHGLQHGLVHEVERALERTGGETSSQETKPQETRQPS